MPAPSSAFRSTQFSLIEITTKCCFWSSKHWDSKDDEFLCWCHDEIQKRAMINYERKKIARRAVSLKYSCWVASYRPLAHHVIVGLERPLLRHGCESGPIWNRWTYVCRTSWCDDLSWCQFLFSPWHNNIPAVHCSALIHTYLRTSKSCKQCCSRCLNIIIYNDSTWLFDCCRPAACFFLCPCQREQQLLI